MIRLIIGILLLAGCSHFGEPLYIKFPEPPHLTFKFCDDDGVQVLCLSESDGVKLSKWMDKVRAFEAARKRLLDRE